MSVFRVFLVHMGESTDQKISEQEHFFCSTAVSKISERPGNAIHKIFIRTSDLQYQTYLK